METIYAPPTFRHPLNDRRPAQSQVIESDPVETGFEGLLSTLSPGNPWGMRQAAARKLGYIGDPRALPKLLETLPGDPFWMVRTAMIQALEKIGDARAVPVLRVVAESDSFAIVRSHAALAVERLRGL